MNMQYCLGYRGMSLELMYRPAHAAMPALVTLCRLYWSHSLHVAFLLVCSTTLQFFSLASPLTSAEILQWDTYGDTAATRGTGVDTTLVVKAAAVGRDR